MHHVCPCYRDLHPPPNSNSNLLWDRDGGRILYFSAAVSSGTSFAYLVDTHGPTGAVHIFALANCVMVVLEYSAAFCANYIVIARGVRASLLVLGAGQVVCWLAAVAMYVFGKRVRSFVSILLLCPFEPWRRGWRICTQCRSHVILTFSRKVYRNPCYPNLWRGQNELKE